MVDGKCNGPIETTNSCQVFCEQRQTGFYGMETRPASSSGDQFAPGQSMQITESTEYSVSHAFSIGVDGVAKGTIGAGVTYQWSITETKGSQRSLIPGEGGTSREYHARWVYFPRLIESCDTLQR